jgi:DNA polymerase III sliding clamp (beta) subunit (PCNA family)
VIRLQIRVDKLRSNLDLLQPVMAKKPTLKVISYILMKDGQMRATNLDTEVAIATPDVGGDAFLLPMKSCTELLKFVPGDLVLSITSQDKSIKLSWNGGSASYMVPDYKDFPETALRAPMSEAVLNGDTLIGAMNDALPYVASNDARPVLTAVAVILGDTVQVTATDAFRTIYESLKLSYPEKQTIAVPADAVKTLFTLWKKAPGKAGLGNSLIAQLTAARPLKLGIWNNNMSAEFGNITLVSKLIAGTYPDILALMNGFKESVKVKFFGPELLAAVRRVAGIAKESRDVVKLQWDGNRMAVSASSKEIGDIQTEIPLSESSQPGRIAISKVYLIEYLTDKDGLITLGTENQTSPAIFHYGNRPLVAVMPMMAKWGDEPPEEPKLQEEPAAESETEGDTGEEQETDETATDEAAEDQEEETKVGTENEVTGEPAAVYSGPPVATVERLNVGTPTEPEIKKRGGRKKKEKTE